jgi:hypothetical protein
MAGPSWLAGAFASVVILAGAYSASRLAISLRRGRATESDADALPAVMGAAMAGMLVPRLSVLPDGVWAVIFGIAAAWFGVRTVRARGFAAAGPPFRLPVPHLIECIAMLYMLLVNGRRPATAMPSMGAAAGPAGSFAVLAVVLALFMLGYIVWTTDWLASLVRARAAAAGPGRNRDRQPPAGVLAAVPCGGTGDAAGPPAAAGDRRDGQDYRPVLGPGLAACGKLTMSIAMGYMLVLML